MRGADTKLAIVALFCLILLALIPKLFAFSLDPISQFAPIWIYVIYRFTGIAKERYMVWVYVMLTSTAVILLFYTIFKSSV